MASLIGFFMLLMRSAPTLFDAMVHSESYFSGSIVVLYLVALITPLVGMFIGFNLVGAGTLLYFWATEPVSINHVGGAGNLVDKNNEKNNGMKP